MKVERFIEDDMRQAMVRVREEMGKDAVILATRRVNGRTEITAALGFDPEKHDATSIKTTLKKKVPLNVRKTSENEELESSPPLDFIQEELARLRKLFEGELSQLAWREKGNQQPNQFALQSRLEATGISRDISAKVVEKVMPCDELELGWRRVLRMLSRVIKVSQDDILNTGGIIALVGPTGVGKTTTAAKIAAQFALKHGRNQVALVTTDDYRVGGQEQLISFGSILGVPVQIATSQEEMRKTLASLSERKLVVIDTAGLSQRDKQLHSHLKILGIKEFDIKPYLVLSSTVQENVINETIKAFSRIKPRACIVNKTDECSNLGSIISGLVRYRLPVSFVCDGQKVPDDIHLAKSDSFIKSVSDAFEESRKPVIKPNKSKKSLVRKQVNMNINALAHA